MKKKSLLSLLLALSLIISTMIPVKAEGITMAGWSELLSSGDGTTTVVSPSEDAARTGDMSLSVTFQAGTTGYKEYIQNTSVQVTLKAGTTYKLGYWYQYYTGMASTGNAKPFIAIGDGNGNFTITRDVHAFQTKPADGGWRECIGTEFTPEEDITGYVSFGFNVKDLAAGSTILIDDIYVCAVGSDENLIPNPSFEETWEAPEVEPDEPEIGDGKTMAGWSDLQSTGDGTTTVVAPSEDAAKTGDMSLSVTFQAGTTGYKEYIQNTLTEVTLKAGVEYEIGYWYQYFTGMASTGNAKPFIAIGEVTDSSKVTIGAFSSEKPADGGWRNVYVAGNYIPEEDITGYVSFGFNVTDLAAGSTILIDDIYIRAVGSDVNLVPNPSFEETWEAPEVEPDEPEVTPEPPEIDDGKTMAGWSNLQSTGDGTTTVVAPSEDAAKTGDMSLSVTFQAGTTGYKEYIQNTLTEVTLKAGVEYEIGYWYQYFTGMASTGNAKPFIAIGEVTDSSKVTIGAFSSEKPADGGWRNVYVAGNYIPEEDITGYVSFGFNVTDLAAGSTILIDDIYIRKVGTDENLIPNPSFEETWVAQGKPGEGWSELVTTNGDHKGVRAKATEIDAKSGTSSLSVTFPNAKTYQKHYIKNTLTQVTLQPGKTYKFGVWYKVDDAITNQHQSWPFFAIGGVDTVWDLSTTETETVNGWKHRWGTVTVEEEIKGALYFGFDPNLAHVTDRTEIEFLFDDIYFCEEGTDVNFVYNPSFEETLAEPFNGMDGWSEPAVTDGDQKGVRINTTEEDVKSGDASLSVIFPNVKTWQKHYILNTSKQITLKAGKTYKFGVWYKMDDAITSQHQSWPFFAIGGVDTVWDLSTTETETEDGWKHRWGTITVEEDITGNLYFGFDPNFGHVTDRIEIEVLFDDIYFCEDGTEENLVYNPSFEKTFSESTISIDGWSEPVTTGGDHKGVSIKATDVEAIDGSYALSVTFPNTKTYQKHYIKNTTGDVTLEAGKTYKFGVWYKVDDSITKQHQSWPFFAIGGVDTVWDLATTEAETVNGWKHRWGTVTVEEDMTGALYFGFDPNLAHVTDRTEIEFLFDNIYFCEDGTDENLVYNGSFEVKEWSVEGYEFDVISGDETVASNIASLKEGENSEVLAKIKIKNNLKDDFEATAIVALYENNTLVEFNFIEQDIPVAEDFFEISTLGSSISVPVMDPEKTYQIKVMLWNSLNEMIPLVEAYVFE